MRVVTVSQLWRYPVKSMGGERLEVAALTWRGMGLLPDEPMADMSEFPPERLRLLRQGNFFDAFPIHLLSRTTLRTLASSRRGRCGWTTRSKS